MKKFFKYLGICILLSISFFYTERTANVVKELDDIMIKIKEEAKNYCIEPIEAIIDKNTIIPGKNGKEIDINNSYREMRYIGDYNSKYLKYKTKYVENKLSDNMNKYIISGNKSINNVSIIFIVDKYDNISKLVDIIEQNKVRTNLFISGKWLENNTDYLYEISKNNIIGSTGYNYSYIDSSYVWVDSVIKRITKQKNSYCLKNEESIDICKNNNNYSIKDDIINNNYFVETKKKLNSGSIFIYKINTQLEKELPLIIKYIKAKGYSIVDLNELLKE